MIVATAAYVVATALWLMRDRIMRTVAFGMARNFVELLQMLFDMKSHLRYLKTHKTWTYVDFFESFVDKDPSRALFIIAETGEEVSRSAVDLRANQIAHWARSKGLKQGDTVAQMMLNKWEFVACWVGMFKVGVSSGLLNTNLTGKSLLHSVELAVKASSKKILVIDDEIAENVKGEIQELAGMGIETVLWSELAQASSSQPSSRPAATERQQVTESDPLVLIYTSGTTGLPKASKISSTRYFSGGSMLKVFCYLRPGDRLYCCLPLYHSAGGLIGVSGVIKSGATMVLRKKFSVRSFTADCLRYRCDATQYIGELCRYLINAPPCEDDAKLSLKYAFGNGMRPDVWVKFQERYNVYRIVEFYGASEGNLTLFNSTGHVGALGYLPSFTQRILPVKILRVDPNQKDTPLKDSNGRCIIAADGEVGLAINRINSDGGAVGRFEGYTDSSASQKKILRDVVVPGDMYFNTGDLLSKDKYGFFYWSDRVGDTFRWKGENVATAEVETVLGAIPGIADVAVYGVAIPGCDGRAGMASVQLLDELTVDTMDWKKYQAECVAHLPVYSRPMFLRIRKAMSVTSTFKHQKSDLVKEGFDPALVKGDLLYFVSPKDGALQLIDNKLFARINSGELKL